MDTILHVVDAPASPTDVFAALTTTEGLSGWWTTKVKVEPSEIQFTFVPEVFNPRMRVVEAREPSSVVWTCVGGAEQWLDARITFDVRDHNWGHYLGSLRAYCESGRGTPFPA